MRRLAQRRALLVLLLTTACTGITTREDVQMPAMAASWRSTIARQVEAEASTRPAADAQILLAQSAAMQAALDSGDRSQVVKVDWAMLFFAAVAGIEHRVGVGDIGPGVGASLRETVDKFNQSWVQLTARMP